MLHTATLRLPYTDALSYFRKIRNGGPICLFESASATDKSSRMSVIGFNPILECIGKDDLLIVRLSDSRGTEFYQYIQSEYAPFLVSDDGQEMQFRIPKTPFYGAEEDRLERQNIVQPLRSVLKAFKTTEKNFMGFYGALAYQFVYQFEDLIHQKKVAEPDFHLFLFDNILLFNHLTQDLTLYVTRHEAADATQDLEDIRLKWESKTEVQFVLSQ